MDTDLKIALASVIGSILIVITVLVVVKYKDNLTYDFALKNKPKYEIETVADENTGDVFRVLRDSNGDTVYVDITEE